MTGTVRADRLVTGPFLLTSGSSLAFFVAVGVSLPVVPRFVEERVGGGSLAVGIAVAALSVAAIACRPLLGLVGERFGRRTLLVSGSLVAAVGFVLTGLWPAMVPLVLLRMVTGVGEAAQFVGAATLINDMSPPQRRAEAASYFSVSVFVGLGVGPLIGEQFADRGAFTAAFVVSALLAVLAAALGTRVPDPAVVARRQRAADGGVAAPRARPRAFVGAAVPTGVVLAMAMFGYTGWVAFVPLQAPEVGASSGTLFASYSALVLVLRVLGAKVPERVGLGRCAAAATVFIGGGLLVMAVTGTATGLVVGTVVMAVGIALHPSLMAITVNRLGDDERAAGVSTFTMFFEVGGAVGGPALGAVAAASTYLGAFAVGGVVALAALPVLVALVLLPRRSVG